MSLSVPPHPTHRACGVVGNEFVHILEKQLPDTVPVNVLGHSLRVGDTNPDPLPRPPQGPSEEHVTVYQPATPRHCPVWPGLLPP